MRRLAWILLLVTPGCLGNLELISPDAGPPGSRPPMIDAQVVPPFVDGGGVLPAPVDGGGPPPIDAGPPSIAWNGVFIAGDDSITAFDNARERVTDLFVAEAGFAVADTRQLSRDRAMQVGGVLATNVENIDMALTDLGVGAGDGCIVYMTSHGNRTGFYINGSDYLTPSRLGQILDRACADRPTVVLISACYSGVFVPDLEAPNRIILTAAREDRTSFGCSAEATYTYWDGCLIDEFPMARTWSELYEKVRKCIEDKEAGGFTPSYPQGSFGADVADMPIFGR